MDARVRERLMSVRCVDGRMHGCLGGSMHACMEDLMDGLIGGWADVHTGCRIVGECLAAWMGGLRMVRVWMGGLIDGLTM